jgi:hypothetical protein
MSTLSLYQDASGRTALHESGYSWLAAFMLPIWLLLRGFKAWVVLLSSVVCTGATLLLQSAWPQAAALVWLAAALLMGALANRWHRWHLVRHGWVRVAQEGAP